jgi:hypothetical protein
MPAVHFGRPSSNEYAPYYERYIGLVPTDDLAGFMRDQVAEVTSLISPLPEDRGGFRYAPGKWTLKEVLGHVSDTERVFSYRALSIARLDPAPLPGFDQDVWNPNGGFNDCTLQSLLEQWRLVRLANLAFLESLPKDAPTRMGRASDNPCSVRALSYVAAGHVAYHLAIVKEKYL